jgi:hypothetical protein
LARAKSTARAEARRRYRASQAAADDMEAGGDTDAAPAGAVGTAQPRRGLFGFVMPDVRGDVRRSP